MKTTGFVIMLVLLAVSSPAGALREAVIDARAARIAERQAEKQRITGKEKADEIAKLRARYPKEMAEIDKLQAQDTAAAQQKLISLAKKYEEATGEKLKAIDTSKKTKQRGPLRRLIKKASEQDSN